MHTGCRHNQCTNYKSFAKRNILHQFKSLINCLTLGYLCYLGLLSFGVWAGEIFVWGAPFLLTPPSDLRPYRNRLKALSAAVIAAKGTTRILLQRGETKIIFAEKLSNLGLVLNKLMQLERVTDRGLGLEPPTTGQCL